MAITGITRTPARPTATMARTTSWAACLSGRGRGITAGTGGAIMAGPGGRMVVADTVTVVADTVTVAVGPATGRDMPTVVVDTGIAQVTPIGAVRLAGMPEAAIAATPAAGSTV